MKDCTSPNFCNHRTLSSIGHGCTYVGYCDFQLPRDSRILPTESKPRVINDRFTDNGDGTISDKEKKVIWVKDPSQVPGFDKAMNFDEAKEACEKLSYAGYHSGWRRPTITELFSIIDYTRKNPMWDTDVFSGQYSYGYWSATEYTATVAYSVNFNYGDVDSFSKSNIYFVRAVRSVQ